MTKFTVLSLAFAVQLCTVEVGLSQVATLSEGGKSLADNLKDYAVSHDVIINSLIKEPAVDSKSVEMLINADNSIHIAFRKILLKYIEKNDFEAQWKILQKLKALNTSKIINEFCVNNIYLKFPVNFNTYEKNELNHFPYADFLITQDYFDLMLKVYDSKDLTKIPDDELVVISHLIIMSSPHYVDGYDGLISRLKVHSQKSIKNKEFYEKLLVKVMKTKNEQYPK